MALVQPGLWLENSNDHHAQAYRLLLNGLVGSRPGVWPDTTVVTQTTGSERKVRLKGTHHYWVPRTVSAHQGYGHAYNDGDIDLDIDAAHATLNRIDLVIVEFVDTATGGLSDQVRPRVVTGTPAASPSAPATPTDSLAVAQVAVAAAATVITNANITNLPQLISAVGGVISCTSSTRPSSPYVGMRIFETNTLTELVWTGTLWQPLNVVYSAVGNAGWTASATLAAVTGATITLPAGKWIVQSSGAFDHATGTSRDYAAQLWNSTDSSQVDLVNANAGDLSAKPAWSLFGTVSISASKTFILRAQTSAVDGTQLMGRWRIWATPVTATL